MAGSSGALYIASAGNETLSAATSTGNNTVFGGAGTDSIVAGTGADTIVSGTGVLSATGGAGNDVFAFFHGNVGTGNADAISDFSASDKVLLSGYGASGYTSVTGGGNTTLTLTDNTTITLVGVTNVGSSQIVST